MALAMLGLFSPACCCGGPYPAAAGPPGTISGQILFPSRVTPTRLAVYAVSTYGVLYDARYVVTWVDPPARHYQVTVPPGDYNVVARFDSDPLSSAGHVACASSSCGPAITRAGVVTCQLVECQPVLVTVHVASGQDVTGVDVGGWGSLRALDLLWSVDEYGAPGPITIDSPTPRVTPKPSGPVPTRQLPPASSEVLPAEFGLPYEYDLNKMVGQIRLPAGWREVANPARAVDSSSKVDFSNQPVASPLALGVGGAWLTVYTHYYTCWNLSLAGETATAGLATSRGASTFYFEDPRSPQGRQPYSGYAFTGSAPWGYNHNGGCLVFRFTVASEQAREAGLPTFMAIVQQAG